MTEIEEVRYPVGALRLGMYVSRLDRPWIETPFLMAGFQIVSEDEIEQLHRYCRHVYVDEARSKASRPPSLTLTGLPLMSVDGEDQDRPERPEPLSREEQQAKYAAIRRQKYSRQTGLQHELNAARSVFDGLQGQVAHIMLALEQGRMLEYGSLREHVQETVESIIRNPSAMMLLVQLERSDQYSYNHALGTSVWCAEFGRHLGLERKDLDDLAMGGMLLDVGKTRLPAELFRKREFTEYDRLMVRTHVSASMDILRDTDGMDPAILQMVEAHHERFDGSGYPRHLHGDQIPLFGRIAGLVDSYDAMTTQRPYTDQVLSPHHAISHIYHWRDGLFEGELIEQFIQTVGIYPAGSLVELNTGQVGVVVSINNERKLMPSVLLMLDEGKNPYDLPKHVNLAHANDGTRVTKGLSPGTYGITFEEMEIEAIASF